MSRRLVDGKLPIQPNPKLNGRKSLLTDELLDKITKPLLIGLPIETCAALQNVSYEAIRQWIVKGIEDPDSIYGAFIQRVEKGIAEWEARDLSVIEMHAQGRPAEYEMEVVRDKDGSVVFKDGKPLTQVAKDSSGNPILKRAEIKSDWKAAMERLARRKPAYWNRALNGEYKIDEIGMIRKIKYERELNPDSKKEVINIDDKIRQAYEKAREDV